MAATVQIRQLIGTTPGTAGSADKTSGTIRFQRVDTTDNTSNANPIPVPTSGQSYSMRVVLRAQIASGTFTQISNPVWYAATNAINDLGIGRKLWYQMSGTYTQPSIPSEGSDPPTLSGNMLDWFPTFTTPADGDAAGPNPGPFDSTGLPKYIGDFLNLVFEVETTSGPGIVTGEQITFAWSEI